MLAVRGVILDATISTLDCHRKRKAMVSVLKIRVENIIRASMQRVDLQERGINEVAPQVSRRRKDVQDLATVG